MINLPIRLSHSRFWLSVSTRTLPTLVEWAIIHIVVQLWSLFPFRSSGSDGRAFARFSAGPDGSVLDGFAWRSLLGPRHSIVVVVVAALVHGDAVGVALGVGVLQTLFVQSHCIIK